MALIALVTYSSGCITEEGSQPSSEKQEMPETEERDDKLLELAAQEPEVSSFIAENTDYEYEITVLHPENVTQLSKKYPVIYGNLPDKTLYKIEYENDRGMLVIVDLENEAVLRYFRTAGVSLE